ncbi:phytanoyl-CoA dioxygenase, peroxisomal-like isoform X2 [Calliopsis andreniformis]
MIPNLRYTKNVKSLTMIQRVFYEKNGFIVIPRVVPQSVLDKCNKRFDDIVAGKVPRTGMIVMYDVQDKQSVNKIQDLSHDEVFLEYIENKQLLDIVEVFTGPNIMAIHNMLIAKPPDIGSGSTKHPPHQDLYYFPYRPADLIVAAWTAIEPCTRENGCLYVSPGSHRLDYLFEHDYPPGSKPGTVNKFYHGILNVPESTKWVHLEMQPGDTVFFHPLLIHGSGVNTSTRTRRAISCHYGSTDCTYVDASKGVQAKIHDEVIEVARKRYPGAEISYNDIWKFKFRLVRGIQSAL